MFHPVGSQAPAVYWRRRLLFVAGVVALIVLLVLTANALSGGDGAASAHNTASGSSSAPAPPARTTTTSPAKTSSSHASSGASSSAASPTGSTAAAVAHCAAKSLAVAAAVGAPSYRAGAHPLLQMQVTNTGSAPCVQDLADKQVELRVYNGESRVWGSHDCKVESGSLERTLSPNVAVKVTISWSGMSSQQGCKGTRQQVGPGSYTLYALLGGHMGKAAQFSLS